MFLISTKVLYSKYTQQARVAQRQLSKRQVARNNGLKITGLSLFFSLALIGCQKPADTESNATSDTQLSEQTQQPVDASVASTNPPATTATSAMPTTPAAATETTSSNRQTAVATIEQPITILALGDSLTEGLGVPENEAYPAQLETALKQAGYANAKVINSGLSGETSTGLVNRLDWVLKTNPDITILTTGANDAMRGLDVATIEQNIRTAIERLQAEGSTVVLGGMQIYDNLGDEYVKAFSELYPKLAKEYDVAFIPFFLEGVGGVAELNQADAIHPTAEGYTRIVNNNILPVLEPTLQQVVDNKTDKN